MIMLLEIDADGKFWSCTLKIDKHLNIKSMYEMYIYCKLTTAFS